MFQFVRVIRSDYLVVAVCLILALRFLLRRPIPRGLRLPPGPPRKFLLGNVLDMPTQQEWVTYSQWAKQYGDLVYLNVLGQPIVIVSSPDIAYELFEKRSSVYSNRYNFEMAAGLMGWDWLVTFMPYGERWRRHRRTIHQHFHPDAAARYEPVQLGHSRELLTRLYETPDQFAEHVRHTAGAIIMEVVYGIKVLARQDPYIDTAEKALASLGFASNPGSFLVDIIPMLKYVPEWFPGASFQTKARHWRKLAVEMNTAPFNVVKQSLKSGMATPSFTASLLEEMYQAGDVPSGQEEVIRGSGSTLYAGGADTTVLALTTFFLAMRLFPEVQRKAQEELDEVVGLSRLPEYEDRENLPYINALCKEVIRWHPVLPLGVGHYVTEDDAFNGYFIPAGSIVVGNTWSAIIDDLFTHLLHDKTYGTDTDKFQPERFLVPGMKDPNPAFGYGRRVCPGRAFAQNSIFIAVTSILSVFDITAARDSRGNDIPVEAAFVPGFLSGPLPFRCTITPRSAAAKKLILQGST
ncbi:cytochrome P450 [Gautieria morchelliformis]|nr:cytochrome P450 [Gautieria morchelliformis]